MEPNNTQQPTEYTDERIAELREEFALPDTFDPNIFPPTKTKGMKASISGAARNGKLFIDEGEYDTAKGYFEVFDDMAHQLNQGYYDAAVIINKLLAEIERLQKLTLAFHMPEEIPQKDTVCLLILSFDKRIERGAYSEMMRVWYTCDGEEDVKIDGYILESDLLRAFEAHLKQKGAANEKGIVILEEHGNFDIGDGPNDTDAERDEQVRRWMEKNPWCGMSFEYLRLWLGRHWTVEERANGLAVFKPSDVKIITPESAAEELEEFDGRKR